jgi:signal transduction histidine kinase
LKLRLLAWFLAFSLVPLVVTNAVGYRRSITIIEGLVENYLGAISQVQSQHVHDRIEHNLSLLDAMAAGNEFLAAGAVRAAGRNAGELGAMATPSALEAYLSEKLRDVSVFEALALTTVDGHVVASAGRADYPSILPLADTRARFTSGLRRDKEGAQPLFRLAVPVHKNGEPPVAYLSGTVNLIGSRDFLQIPPHLTGHVESFIVDEGGWPLFVSHPHGRVDYTASLMSPLVGMPAGARAHYRDAEGVEVIGTITNVPGYPWRFISQVPATEALGSLRQLGTLSLILELLFGGLLVTTAWIVARDIVAPVNRLVAATGQVGKGDLGVRVAAGEPGELGELGRAFNEMASALAATTQRVHELHQREIERASQLATVGELASGVVHEIKNPVVAVSSGLDLVRRRVGEDATLTPILGEMGRELERIQQTLHGLLAFARPAVPALARVNGNHVVERAVRLVQPAAQHAGVHLAVTLDPGLPCLLVDEEMLYQALVNVFMNAVEATPNGGQVTVRTIAGATDYTIETRDTGRGIPAADLDNVFKPFFTTRHTGTGLGLPISRQIVQRHGGRLTLESQEGEGTSVTIRIPLAAASANPTPERPEVPRS